jgi:hypothetical protein
MALMKKNLSKSPSVFISHCHSDKRFAKKLAKDLLNIGVRVWIDEAEIKLGDSLIKKIQEGIDQVDYLVVVLSPESVSSEWVSREIDIAMNQEINGRRVKVLPLLYKTCDLPLFLSGKLYGDCTTSKKYQKSLNMLIDRLGLSNKTSELITDVEPKLKNKKETGTTHSLYNRMRKANRVEVYRLETLDVWPYESLISALVAKPNDEIFLNCNLVYGTKYCCQSMQSNQFINWGLVGHNFLDGENFEDELGNSLGSAQVEAPEVIWIQIEYVLFHSTKRRDDIKIDPFRKSIMAKGVEGINLPTNLIPKQANIGYKNDAWWDWYEMNTRKEFTICSLYISSITNLQYINAHTIPQSLDYGHSEVSIIDYISYNRPPKYSEIFDNFDIYYKWFVRTAELE